MQPASDQGTPPPAAKKTSTATILLVLALGMGVVCCLGSVAVGVPAYRRFQQRAKSTEAVMQLGNLYRASMSYAASLRGQGPELAIQFPQSAPLTPASVPRGTRVVDPAGTWDTPTWRALGFAVNDPHFYSYQYVSSGVGVGATFTARANGDLDGDGDCSTFERSGVLGADLEVHGSPRVFTTHELE